MLTYPGPMVYDGQIFLQNESLVKRKPKGIEQGVTTTAAISLWREKYTFADSLAHSGIMTMIDATHAIVHNKVMIMDGETVFTGSFNFARTAEEKNDENLLVIRDKLLGERYRVIWQEQAQHSEIYAGKRRWILLLTSCNRRGTDFDRG